MKKEHLRWNGWGRVEGLDILGDNGPGIWEWLGRYLGQDPLPDTPAVPLDAVTLPPIRLDAPQLQALASATAPDRVMTDNFERAYHARGRSYHDLLHLRDGLLETAPDAVVYPETAEEIQALTVHADKEHIALTPYGGGSSVVGGVTPTPRPGQRAAVTVDLARMNRILDINLETMSAHIEAGIYGPELERQLQARGVTLGHYPQSFEYSTLGGWIAARGAGHQSNKYGKAEDWLIAATLATPQGRWRTEHFPASAAGPMLRDVVPGSEGAFGIISDAWVRIHNLPETKDYRAWFFQDFGDGVQAARDLLHHDVPTAMVRLSDVQETFFYSVLHGGAEVAENGPLGFCLMLVGFEGAAKEVACAKERAAELLQARGGADMGASFGETWLSSRFDTPYLRDPMLDRGLGVDTIETAIGWDKLPALHDSVSAAIERSIRDHNPNPDVGGIVMAHVSHSYRDGASLYFTFVFPRCPDAPIEQWLHIKRDATEAIVNAGGTLSHHHGVGTDHLPWMGREKGPVAQALLASIKTTLDPNNILNPGKMVP